MKPSPLTIELIKRFESFRPTSYKDSGGLETIGYGHLILKNEDDLLEATLSKEDAESLLLIDITAKAPIDAYIDPTVFCLLTDGKISALTSLCFNVGIRNFIKSTLLRLLNEDDFLEALDQFAVWKRVGRITANGLIKRRLAEQMIFNGKILTMDGGFPSTQWNDSFPLTDSNWIGLNESLRKEAIEIASVFVC